MTAVCHRIPYNEASYRANNGHHDNRANNGHHGNNGLRAYNGHHGTTNSGHHGTTNNDHHGNTNNGYHGTTNNGYHSYRFTQHYVQKQSSVKTDRAEQLNVEWGNKKRAGGTSKPRPHSSYHSKCVESVVCSKHSLGYVAPIRSGTQARLKIREMLQRNKELLVAILDCCRVLPELFQSRLINQVEVDRVSDNITKQAQSRALLNIMANQTPLNANKMIQVICRLQPVFSRLLSVSGLDAFLRREEKKLHGLDGYAALKCLENADTATLKCPICSTPGRKKRSQSARIDPANVSQMRKEFSRLELRDGRVGMRPKSSPMTLAHKAQISKGLALINSVSTEFKPEDNRQWISVLLAEPEIIKIMHRET